MSKTRLVWFLLKHKWFILIAGRQTGAPLWRLLIHDLSKLTPSEFSYYVGYVNDNGGQVKYAWAWLHHQNNNPHHWEYWIPRSSHYLTAGAFPANEPVPMPDWAIKEMVADWMASRRANSGKWPTEQDWPWLRDTYKSITLHDETRNKVDRLLENLRLK